MPLPLISFVPHYSAPPKPMPLALLPELLKRPIMRDLVEPLRDRFESVFAAKGLESAKKAIREEKAHLPAVLASGLFSVRKIVGLESYSCIVPLDFDGLSSRSEANAFKEIVSHDAQVYLAFLSPSGRGVKVFVRVPDRKHGLNYEMAACYAIEHWDRAPDPSGKDVVRLCFASFDPAPYWNPAAAVLQFNHSAWLRDTGMDQSRFGQKRTRRERREDFDYDPDDACREESNRNWSGREASFELVQAAVAAIDDSFAKHYEDWLRVGFALHWWGGNVERMDEARELFHVFSAKCPAKYSPGETDAKWDSIEKSSRWLDSDAVTIGTVFYYAVESGFELGAQGREDDEDRDQWSAPRRKPRWSRFDR